MNRLLLLILAITATSFAQGCVSDDSGPNAAHQLTPGLPKGFVYAESVVPGIMLDMRYATKNNFIGDVIDGYDAPRCIMTREAAMALRDVQLELNKFSMSLKIYDAYRPQRAVDHFVRWSKNLSDDRMKKDYYPEISKELIFKGGFIWTKSNHSKGSTADLTIVLLPSKKELDMGSHFDYFGTESWTESVKTSPEQKANRLLLKLVMEKHGFVNYDKEWWHYTLKNEPYPDTYFNFPVR